MRKVLEETLKCKISDKMMDSYVDLQFSATDKNFNGVIEFDEFISLYSKIYLDPEVRQLLTSALLNFFTANVNFSTYNFTIMDLSWNFLASYSNGLQTRFKTSTS